jgi:hypothetical protein
MVESSACHAWAIHTTTHGGILQDAEGGASGRRKVCWRTGSGKRGVRVHRDVLQHQADALRTRLSHARRNTSTAIREVCPLSTQFQENWGKSNDNDKKEALVC